MNTATKPAQKCHIHDIKQIKIYNNNTNAMIISQCNNNSVVFKVV